MQHSDLSGAVHDRALAGFVDFHRGCGGLITVPVLLELGLSPADALGRTNCSLRSVRPRDVPLQPPGLISWEIPATVLSATASFGHRQLVVERIDPRYLRQAIQSATQLRYLLVRPRLGAAEARARMAVLPFKHWPRAGAWVLRRPVLLALALFGRWRMSVCLASTCDGLLRTLKFMNVTSSPRVVIGILAQITCCSAPGGNGTRAIGRGPGLGRGRDNRGTEFIRPI